MNTVPFEVKLALLMWFLGSLSDTTYNSLLAWYPELETQLVRH